MSGRLEVACATEGREYVAHAATMLHSLLARPEHAGARVHYLHGLELGPLRRSRLRGMVERLGGGIRFHRVPDRRLAGLPTRGFTGKATWYRVLLPELLGEVPRVLYLDADLIVVDDLRPLFALPLDGALVAAVTNVFQPAHAHRPAELGLAGPEEYFNAGVLLLDLDAMRREGSSTAILRAGAARAGDLVWRDQDALNLALAGRRLELHPRWNLMNSVSVLPEAAATWDARTLTEAREQPAIRHFEGPTINKPWHPECEREGRELYLAHRAATPWPLSSRA